MAWLATGGFLEAEVFTQALKEESKITQQQVGSVQ